MRARRRYSGDLRGGGNDPSGRRSVSLGGGADDDGCGDDDATKNVGDGGGGTAFLPSAAGASGDGDGGPTRRRRRAVVGSKGKKAVPAGVGGGLLLRLLRAARGGGSGRAAARVGRYYASMTSARRQQLLLRAVVASLCGSVLLWTMSGFGGGGGRQRQQQQQPPISGSRTKKHLDGTAGRRQSERDSRRKGGAAKDDDVYRHLPRLVYYGYQGDNAARLRAATIARNGSATTTAKGRRRRKIRYPIVDSGYWEYLAKSREFSKTKAESMYTDECEPQYRWQTSVYPTCNLVHEFADLTKLSYPSPPPFSPGRDREWGRLIANGFWRDVFILYEEVTDQYRVTKSLRYGHELTDRNYDRNRRDAMALERLTASHLVVNIFGYCSATGVFEYSDGGDIYAALLPSDDNDEKNEAKKKKLSSLEKLQIATQSAMGLAEVHNIDKEGQASIAHTDISPDQFILIDGLYRINDFNRARFISKNRTSGENCPYFVGKNPGKFRSPEEYKYDPQSEKIDVYSFGNIVYTLLMEETPFADVKSSKKVAQMVAQGKRPPVYSDVWNSTDPILQSLKEAMVRAPCTSPGCLPLVLAYSEPAVPYANSIFLFCCAPTYHRSCVTCTIPTNEPPHDK